jgi:hypothetical protein
LFGGVEDRSDGLTTPFQNPPTRINDLDTCRISVALDVLETATEVTFSLESEQLQEDSTADFCDDF